MALADRCIRRLFRYVKPKNPCLVHCFTLAEAAENNIKIFFELQKSQMVPGHAYVKYRENLYSTATVSGESDSLMVWNKA